MVFSPVHTKRGGVEERGVEERLELFANCLLREDPTEKKLPNHVTCLKKRFTDSLSIAVVSFVSFQSGQGHADVTDTDSHRVM